MKIKIKKIISAIAASVLVVSQAAFAAEFSDMPDDWSTAALKNAVNNGLLGGSDGRIYPNDFMTRAEMATIMARACGAVTEADISNFTDVDPDEWYYSSMAKAVAMKAFAGSDNKLNPDDFITRQEAFVVLARVFSLNLSKKIDETVIDDFKDADQVASWAKKEIAAVIGGGYVSGSDGYINPEDNISRAEFAVVMDRLVKHYIDDAQITELPEDGNVMVRVGDITIENPKGDRMIVIGDGAGQSEVNINDAELTGDIVIRGGKNVNLQGKFGEIRVVMPNAYVDVAEAKATYKYIGKGSTLYLGTLAPKNPTNTETDKPVTDEKKAEAETDKTETSETKADTTTEKAETDDTAVEKTEDVTDDDKAAEESSTEEK